MNISHHLLKKPDLHPDESCVKDETLRKSTILWPTVVSWATNTSNFTYEKSPLNIDSYFRKKLAITVFLHFSYYFSV